MDNIKEKDNAETIYIFDENIIKKNISRKFSNLKNGNNQSKSSLIRKDYYGNEIIQGKEFKVTFRKKRQIKEVENWKEYNVIDDNEEEDDFSSCKLFCLKY